MGDAGSGLLGLALIVGLFVAYAMQRRGKGRAERAAATPAPPELAEPMRPPEPMKVEVVVRGSSPNWGAPILFVLLLFGAASQRGNAWGYLWQALFAAFVLLGAYTAFSAKEFAAEKVRNPEVVRRLHMVTFGVPYVLLPVVGWVVAIPLGRNWGVLIPAAPWVLLAVVGIVAVVGQGMRKPGGPKGE